MKNNKGYTLIELMIVIAILGILSGGVVVSIRNLSYANTIKTANSIHMAMKKLRLETMTKAEKQYLYLYKIDEAIYIKVSTKDSGEEANLDISSGTKISVRNSLYFYDRSEAKEMELENNNNNCFISFEKSSGAFSVESDYGIRIESSNKTAYIKCILETGRIEVK